VRRERERPFPRDGGRLLFLWHGLHQHDVRARTEGNGEKGDGRNDPFG
jgi:hypothetical protein